MRSAAPLKFYVFYAKVQVGDQMFTELPVFAFLVKVS
jgi:hypothetical protein